MSSGKVQTVGNNRKRPNDRSGREAHGLAASPWPKFRQNNANTGYAQGQSSSVTPADTPGAFGLFQNYPNPFNPKTAIICQWPAAAQVKLAVYDLLGREVSTLLNGVQPPGTYAVTWDATGVASGMYVARLTARVVRCSFLRRPGGRLSALCRSQRRQDRYAGGEEDDDGHPELSGS